MDSIGENVFLDLIDVRLDAFAICEIGKEHRLNPEPLDKAVVHFVLKGEGFLECGRTVHQLTRGTIAVLPKKQRLSLRGAGPITRVCDAPTPCRLEDGLVSFKAVSDQADLVLGCAILNASVGADLQLFHHLKEPIVEQSEPGLLLPLFEAMLRELRQPRLGTRAFVSALMKQVLIVVLRAEASDQASLLRPMMNPRLAGVAAAILSRPQDNHTVDSLAASAGMSRSRFSQQFSETYGSSPKEFVLLCRLSSAAKLLKCSALPVKSVAASVGYASRSHFSRAFQARYGVDPSKFRREHLRENC